MNFAESIKELCKEHGTNIKRLEQDLGFGNGYIRRLSDTMPTDRAVKIAEYFGLPSDYFFSNQKKEPSKEESPLLAELMKKWDSLTEMEQMELLSFAGYIQSKHKDI